METLGALLPLLLIVGVFWLLILRPAQKRQRAAQQLVSAVRPGQRVMTTAGMLGTVIDVTDDQVGLEVAPGVVIRYVKAAIGQILPDEDEGAVAAEEATDAEESATDQTATAATVRDGDHASAGDTPTDRRDA